MKRVFIWFSTFFLLLAGCGEAVTNHAPSRILMMGDSLMAANAGAGKGVSHAIERELGEQVIDRSVIGARMLYALPISGAAGLSIPKQYRPGKWDWVVLNGGGNDLWLGCGCFACAGKMNRLISPDGRTGTIPGLVSKLRHDGARVIYVGYLRTPGVHSPIEGCVDEGAEFESRIAKLAALDAGVYFLSLADLVPHGDKSFHAADRIHPSTKGSAEIGHRIAAMIGE